MLKMMTKMKKSATPKRPEAPPQQQPQRVFNGQVVIAEDKPIIMDFISDEYEYKEYEDLNVLALIIDSNYLHFPDKRTKAYKKWQGETNKLITQYNDRVKFKCFNFVK